MRSRTVSEALNVCKYPNVTLNPVDLGRGMRGEAGISIAIFWTFKETQFSKSY